MKNLMASLAANISRASLDRVSNMTRYRQHVHDHRMGRLSRSELFEIGCGLGISRADQTKIVGEPPKYVRVEGMSQYFEALPEAEAALSVTVHPGKGERATPEELAAIEAATIWRADDREHEQRS